MNIKIIRTTSFVSLTIAVILIIIFLPDFSYAAGLVLGTLASLVGYIILDHQISQVRASRLKGALIINRIVRYIIYILVFMVSYFNQENISIITTILGLFMVKLSILIIFYQSSLKNRKKKQ